MPDVIIKGMEMPESCYSCHLRKRNGMEITCPVLRKSFSVADVNILHYRLKDCPLRPAPEWISVEEPPRIGERVILRAGELVCEGYFTSAHTWWRVTGAPMRDLTDQPVTHWMPLPEPPKENR